MHIQSSYWQYKEDTNKVASWLAQTAEECGFIVDFLGEKCTEKSRKSYIISIPDFVTLANCIAGFHNPPVHIPKSFLAILNRVISMRKRHGQQVSYKNEKADECHGFFINTLERVRDILQRCNSTPTSPADTISVSNKFDELEIYEPAEYVEPSPSIPTLTPPTDQYKADQPDDIHEAFFAFQLLLVDYQKIRTSIQTTWEKYAEDEIDLVSASLTTHTAFNMARHLEQDVKDLFDKFGGTEMLYRAWYGMMCMYHGETHADMGCPDEMNFRMYDISKDFFWPVYILLRKVLSSDEHQRQKPCLKNDRDADAPELREEFQRHKAMLTDIMPDVFLLCCEKKAPAQDMLVQGMSEFQKSKQMSLHWVLSAQIYLDVQDILGDRAKKGFVELETISSRIEYSIRLTRNFHKMLRMKTWPRPGDNFNQIQQQINDWIKSDSLLKAKREIGYPQGKPFRLLQSYPLMCGLLACNLQVTYQDVSVAFINTWGSVLYTYHLYNALCQERAMETEWADMEYLFNMQHDIFVGDIPKNGEDYLKQCCLSMGYSATMFAKDKRRMSLQPSKRGPRSISGISPLSRIFMDTLSSGCEDNLAGLYIRKIHTTDCQSTLGELVKRLQKDLQLEATQLNFDFLSLHRACWLVLRSIKARCDADLQQTYGPGYLEAEEQLPFIVSYIFMASAGVKKLGNLLSAKDSDKKGDILMNAGGVMEEYTQQCGNICKSK